MANEFMDNKRVLREEAYARFPYEAMELQKALRQNAYFLDELTCRKITQYLALGKPVGLRGEPGVGKSELAERIAALLHARFLDIECHSQLEASDIGVSWNGFRQLLDAQSGQLQGDAFTLPYLSHTPLMESLLSDETVVLRVDEVDKLNEHTANFFLRFLDKRELVVHDLREHEPVIRARAVIHVFLTSNEYHPLDPALMRRIAWVDLSFPGEEQLAAILHTKTAVPSAMARRVAYLVTRLRSLQLKKKPSIGEAIEFTRGLILETDGSLTLDALRVTLGFLLKYQEDERKGWEELKRWLDTTS